MRRRVYIIWMGTNAHPKAIHAARALRDAGLVVEVAPIEQKVGKALAQADKRGANYAVILGDNEVASGEWTLKTLATGEQKTMREPDLVNFLKSEKTKAGPSLREG